MNVPQTVLALRGSDGFSRDLGRVCGVCSQSLGARSYCKNEYLVTLTFAPLERNRGSRAQMLFDHFLVHRCLQPAAAGRRPAVVAFSVETGWMSSDEAGQVSALC